MSDEIKTAIEAGLNAVKATQQKLEAAIEKHEGQLKETGTVAGEVKAEVKALSVQTQKATDEISRKIASLQKDAAGSIDAVHRISTIIDGIRPLFTAVTW